MTHDNELKQARNLIRWIFRKMDNEFDIRFREKSRFFFTLMNKCKDVGAVQEDHDRFILTVKEQIDGITGRPRHKGPLLY